MAIATDRPAPKWRNFAIWSLTGAIACAFASVVAAALSPKGFEGAFFHPSPEVAAKVGLVWILSAGLVGLSMRNRPVSLRKIGNFALVNVVAAILLVAAIWGLGTPTGKAALSAMGLSERIALAIGGIYLAMGVMMLGARAAVRFMDAEQADDFREQSGMFITAAAVMALWGTALIVLALAAPGGVVTPSAALVVTLTLVAASGVLSIMQWRRMDELSRTLSIECGNWSLYLLLIAGGGWAMLAHLGFVTGPAPLDWLTMLFALMLVASFIATGRRGLLQQR